jgi:ASC-1-like (ASCH) protein
VILHLNLKAEYFDDIKNGKKPFEFRLDNEYWRKKLMRRNYDEVHFKCGYPSRDDKSKIIKKKYIGYEMKSIKHKHFGNTDKNDEPISVFAIRTYGEPIL